MTEREYLLVTNRLRITIAKDALRPVVCLPDPADSAKLAEAIAILDAIEQKLFGQTKTKTS